MVDKHPPQDDGDTPAATQIPLLEDIVDTSVPTKRASGTRRRIEPDAALPETHDLFNPARNPASDEAGPASAIDAVPPVNGADEEAMQDDDIDAAIDDALNALDDLDERLEAGEDDLVFADDIMIEGDLWVEDTSTEPPHATFRNVPWSVVDELPPLSRPPETRGREPGAVAAAPPPNASPDNEARLRAGADRMVEDLVREYSQEIVSRLRDELTALLDELKTDKGPDAKT